MPAERKIAEAARPEEARALARAHVDALWRRGTEFLGTQVAVMGGAMTWVSERTLVAAISNAGGFGVIACGAMTPDLLDAEIAATFELTRRPFGVNLITLHPELAALIDVCVRRRVSHVVLAGALPSSAACSSATPRSSPIPTWSRSRSSASA